MRRIDDTEAVLDEDGVVLRGRIKVPLYLMDSVRATFKDGTEVTIDASLCRPGYRFMATDEQIERVAMARDRYIARTCDAWRSPAQVEAEGEARVLEGLAAALGDGDPQVVREAAYCSYRDRISSAWKQS
jgi:hypothetical protein